MINCEILLFLFIVRRSSSAFRRWNPDAKVKDYRCTGKRSRLQRSVNGRYCAKSRSEGQDDGPAGQRLTEYTWKEFRAWGPQLLFIIFHFFAGFRASR
jgi:hypothetical protein